MERLLVFADFDWLDKPELVGELCYEKLRGSDSYAFQYDEHWLKGHAEVKLSEDINNYPGMQYTQPGQDVFGCFSDALPDRWGRTMLKRREQILASEEKERSVLFLLSIILWASMTFREWVALDLKKNWKGNLSMSQLRSRYPH